ncbi:protein rep [Cellulomonas cellasea]|uniref:Uncharacterized protein n=1 Tax=Cellulomonas cellasea DSM 20118 TaxID=1408250 RepID=A0A0A0B893_9CELL|nr:protein rep [Cellulomonas cellasea]KGM02004.1 hypothetical protein Q760_16110 [Cellulomonas cellasea DSM 20118]
MRTTDDPTAPTPEPAARRRSRYKTRAAIQQLMDEHGSQRRRFCGHTTGGSVQVRHTPGAGGLRGVQRCGSVWLCPTCAATIGQHRADELSKALDTWRADPSHDVVMLTLTMRHHQGHTLAQVRDAYRSAWRAVTSGRAWTRTREAAGVVGYTRSTELTVGANGWHLHAHVLLFLDRPHALTRLAVEAFAMSAFDRWAAKLVAAGLPRPIASSGGLDLRAIREGGADGLATYLVKMAAAADDATGWVEEDSHRLPRAGEPGRTAGQQLATEAVRADLKAGRRENRTMWQVISDYLAHGEVSDRDIWREYEAIIPGTQMLVWSRGLRAAIAALTEDLPAAELTDQQVVDRDREGTTLGMLDATAYGHALRVAPDVIADVVTAAGAATPAEALVGVQAVLARYNERLDAEAAPQYLRLHLDTDPARIHRLDEGFRRLEREHATT